jgi:glutaredoxin
MYVVYTKTGCEDCDKVKALLSNEPKIIINCDEMLKNNRKEFINSMELKTRVPFRQFPLIFRDNIYIGGYYDLVDELNFEMVEEF